VKKLPQGHGQSTEDESKRNEGSALFDYFQTPHGHEVVTRIVAVIEGIQKTTLESGARQAEMSMTYTHRDRKLGRIVQTVVLILVVGAAVFLSYNGRLDATTGVLLGTLAGYFFARRTSN
jgi:hypothetical protein